MERYLTQLGVKPSKSGNASFYGALSDAARRKPSKSENTSFLENGRKAVFLKNPDPAIRVLPASLPAV